MFGNEIRFFLRHFFTFTTSHFSLPRPMLHLTFAPNASYLIEPIAGQVRNLWNDPFCSPVFLVPNLAVGKWLKLRLSEMFGCIIDPEFYTIEKFLWDELQPDVDMEILHKEILQHVICALLDIKKLQDKRYFTINKYLTDNSKNEIDPVKKVQLAGEIARLFLEYEYNRPGVWDYEKGNDGTWRVDGISRSWINDKLYFSVRIGDPQLRSRVEENEIWQRDIYRMIFGPDGLLSRQIIIDLGNNLACRYLTLPQLYAIRHETTGNKFLKSTDNRPAILFLLTKISHFHRNMLLEMATYRNIFAFFVNPCSEFWEDVDTSRHGIGKKSWFVVGNESNPPIARMSSSDYEKEELDTKYQAVGRIPEHRLLELWGASGKESIALWCQATQYDFNFLLPEDKSQSGLSRLQLLQKSILLRDDSVLNNSSYAEDDDSILIFSAPEPGREVEALREYIIDLLYKDNDLKLEDIAVYLPDPSKYISFIYKVFGAFEKNDEGYISFTVLGIDQAISYVSRAVEDLCALCEGDFTRNRLYSFLRNEAVRNARNISLSEIDIWENWSMKLGLFRGFNSEHRREMGDHESVASDSHTFECGMTRLLLGSLAADPVDLGMHLNAPGIENPAPFRDFDTSDKEIIEKFCSTIETLANKCREFRRDCNEMTPSEAVNAFRNIVDSWIIASSSREQHFLKEFLRAIDGIRLQQVAAGRKNIPFEEFISFVKSSLLIELPENATPWSGCLTFAPLRSGFILPHKIIIALGMDADSFPGYSIDAPINLLLGKRIIGDPDPVRDNRYAFLELICSAKERLVIYFQGIDVLRDRIMQPSNVVMELASVAGLHVPDIKKGPAEKGVIPLIPYDNLQTNNNTKHYWDPNTAKLAVLANNCLRRSLYRLPDYPYEMEKEGNISVASALYKTTVGDIKKFLNNPLEYRLFRSLGFRNDDFGNKSSVVDEPIQSDFLTLFEIKNSIFRSVLKLLFRKSGCGDFSYGSLFAAVRKITEYEYEQRCISSKTPDGMFSKWELNKLIVWAELITENLLSIARRFEDGFLYLDADIALREDGVNTGIEFTDDNNYRYRIGMQVPAVLKALGKVSYLAIIKLGGSRSFKNKTDDMDMWINSLLFKLHNPDIEKMIRIIISHSDGSLVEREWEVSDIFYNNNGKNWILSILHDMFQTPACEHTPAIWFEKVYINNNEFGDSFISQIKALEEEERYNEYPIYRSDIDIYHLTEARLPSERKILERSFRRLLPILRDSFNA